MIEVPCGVKVSWTLSTKMEIGRDKGKEIETCGLTCTVKSCPIADRESFVRGSSQPAVIARSPVNLAEFRRRYCQLRFFDKLPPKSHLFP
jgi:hypothetical protein